jgi:hypothetical protein
MANGRSASSSPRLAAAVVASLLTIASGAARSRDFSADGRAPTAVARDTAAIAREMMPDDVLSASDGAVLAELHRALAPGTTSGSLDPADIRRSIESLTRRHPGLTLRWLLGADRRVALGYERGALMDILITSQDSRAHALAVDALLERPGLGYCMRALPARARAGRLARIVDELAVVEALRREGARLLLSVGDPAEAARTHAAARARAEAITAARPDVVRRWLLDETDAGIFDSYRATIVRSFLGSAHPGLRALAAEVAGRRARLAPSAAVAVN